MAPSILIELFYILNCVLLVYGSHHWIVTDQGRIEPKLDSAFPVHRSYDLMLLLAQEQRLLSVLKMHQQLVEFKVSVDKQWSEIELETEFEKRLYATDANCLYADHPLNRYKFNPTFIDFPTNNRIKIKNSYFMKKPPNCKDFSKLDFSLLTFPHLKTMVEHANMTASFEEVESVSDLDVDLEAMLTNNKSDWTAYNLASFYWQIQGNGSNAIECARRAIYFAPKEYRYLPIFNLGTLLQAAYSLGEAAIVLHMAIDLDRGQYRSHVALGHVYSYLNDYPRAAGCYENALSLRPDLTFLAKQRAAVLCHQRLINGLWSIDAALKKIVEELQAYSQLQERWVVTHTEIDLERAYGKISKPFTDDLHTLWKAVERQALLLSERMTETTPSMVFSSFQDQKTLKGAAREGSVNLPQDVITFKTEPDESCPDCQSYQKFYSAFPEKSFQSKVSEFQSFMNDLAKTGLSPQSARDKISNKLLLLEQSNELKESTYWQTLRNCLTFEDADEISKECSTSVFAEYLKLVNGQGSEISEDLLDESTIENYVHERSILRGDSYHDLSEL